MKKFASAGANLLNAGFHLQAESLNANADWKKDKIKRPNW
jgi:hypothetical protein